MKYVSCELAQHGICFISNQLWSCCYSPADQVEGSSGPVVLIDNYHGEKINWGNLFRLINERKENFKKGIIPPSCQNCYWLEEKEWSEENYINQIYISHFERCNADCFYCSGCQNKERDNKTKEYSILHVLKDMKKNNIMPRGSEIHIGGGEPTLYHELDSIINEFVITRFARRILVPTSGILYLDVLYEAMIKNLAYIVVSLDSGCAETYLKIKRVNKFENVIDNISKYARSEVSINNIQLKYIVIPEINSNKNEFKLFLKKANELGIKRIALDIEANYVRKINYKVETEFLNFVSWAEEYSKMKGFEVDLYMFYKQAISYKI